MKEEELKKSLSKCRALQNSLEKASEELEKELLSKKAIEIQAKNQSQQFLQILEENRLLNKQIDKLNVKAPYTKKND